MSLRIGTNPLSMNSRRHLYKVERQDTQNLERMATGDRIAQSYHDPAGHAISNRMQAKIRSRHMAEKNAGDTISKFQIAEGSLGTMQAIAIRMRELAIQAANDPLNKEAMFSNIEFTQLKNEVQRIADTTAYNSLKLLNNKNSQFHYQVGIHSNTDNNRITLEANKILTSINNLGITGLNISNKEGARRALAPLSTMLDNLSQRRTELGALHARMITVIDNNQIQNENEYASKSRIRDADMAKVTAEDARLSVLKQTTVNGLYHANTFQAKRVMQLLE